MSRIGKNAIPVPDKTTVSVTDGVVAVKGPLGALSKPVHSQVTVTVADGAVQVSPVNTSKLARSLWGTYASHVKNMIRGVNEKYQKQLDIQGVGYKAEMQGAALKLSVGFSHPVIVPVPAGIEVTVVKNLITIAGIDKELVGQFAANVRAFKKPEPYKGKGIRYVGEYVRQKQGKKVV